MIEIIDGVPVDWNKFKSKAKGGNLDRAKQGYIDFCKLLYSNNHKLISDYSSARCDVYIKFDCEHDAHLTTPHNYKIGRRCPKCSGHCPEQAKKDFLNMIKENGHTLLSEYVNDGTNVLVDFGCGHPPNKIKPNNYKNGKRCPYCSIEKISMNKKEKSKSEFINLINKNGHKLLSEYTGNHNKVLIKFDCEHEAHWITPSNYKNGKGCPYCKNKGEATLYKLLIDMGYEVKSQHKYEDLRDKYQLKYDFYLPQYNLLIELDGDHHRKVLPYYNNDMTQKERDMAELDAFLKLNDRQCKDKLKDDYAKVNNIPLLRIPYHNNKRDLVKWKQLVLDKINTLELQEIAQVISYLLCRRN